MTQRTDDSDLGVFLLAALGILVLFPVLFMGFGMMGTGTMMGGMWGGHMWGDSTASGWLPIVGLLVQVVFLSALLGGTFLLYRTVSGDRGRDPEIEELRSAYARGELTDEEYEKRRDVLEHDRSE